MVNIGLPIIKSIPKYIETKVNGNEIICGGGLPLASFLKWLKNNLSGLEFATGVPASIGGMYTEHEWKIEVSDFVKKLIHDKNGTKWINRSDKTAYRWTSFHNESVIILAVKLELKNSNESEIKSKITII